MKISRRFDFNYKPLLPSQSITATSSVPDRQTFDANTGIYTPDYTLTPLTVRANTSIIDLDGIIPSGDINSRLANIRWYATVGGKSSIITASDPGYIIGAEGTPEAGQIQVTHNIDPLYPLTLTFQAEFVDPRTGQIFRFNLSKLLRCNTEAASMRFEIDTPPQVIYNPVRHSPIQVITASLAIGKEDIPPSHRLFIWETLRDNGTWSPVGNSTDGELDYWGEISADGSKLTVDRTLIGDSLTVRCLALYDPSGSPATQQVTPATPVRTVTFIRRIPEYEYDMLYVPYNIPHTPYIYPRCQIRDTIGILTDSQITENFDVGWFMATNKPGNATLTYQQIGTGIAPRLSTSLMSDSLGGVLALDVTPRQPLKALSIDGKILTVDGKILLAR